MPAAAALAVTRPAPALTKETLGTRRPRLLITAARHGMDDYRRQRDLPRLIGPGIPKADVTEVLAALEERMETARRANDPAWSCFRHVEVLIALLSERALRAE